MRTKKYPEDFPPCWCGARQGEKCVDPRGDKYDKPHGNRDRKPHRPSWAR